MKLAGLFAASTGALALLIVVALGRVVLVDWQKYRDSDAGLLSMELAHKAMVAAEKVSFERGPSNGVLGDRDPPDPAKADRLAKARQTTDAALGSLQSAVAASPNPLDAEALGIIAATRAALPTARQRIDQVAALPRADRSPEQTTEAIGQMISVVPIAMGAVSVLSRNAANVYPQFTDALTNARLSVELREYAGQLGSRFTAALTAQQPLSEAEQGRIQVLRGRIEQLRSLIGRPTRGVGMDRRAVEALQVMEARYFGVGLAFVRSVEQAGKEGRPYGMDTAQFAARYVPEMSSIVQLRDVLVTVSIEGAREAHRAARNGLLLASATVATALLLLAALFVFLRHRVVQPLLGTARVLVQLAKGDLSASVQATDRRDEIGDILRALVALRAVSIEKLALEQDRQVLIEELKVSSSTDYLTGILNRRAFTDAANAQVRRARDDQARVAVILFDIDRFKTINDSHGHDVGDMVLMSMAGIVKPELREGEIFARYGGEEFIAMPVNCDLAAAQAMAERIRAAIEAATIPLPDGQVLRVTASFGVASASGSNADLAALFQAADSALYRAKQSGRNRVQAAD